MIDKLNFLTHHNLNTRDIIATAEKLNFIHTLVRIGHHKNSWSLRISKTKNKFIDFPLLFSTSSYSRKIFTNPSRFNNFFEYKSFIQEIIGRNHYECLTIIRIDLAVDLPISLSKCLTELNVQYKREAKLFIDSANSREGITIGKGNEIIVVYDKLKRLEKGETTNELN